MVEDKVSLKISTDAKVRVEEIEKGFAERIKKSEAEQEERKKAYRKETRKLAELEEERISREILAEARLASRKETLSARHDVISQVLNRAAEKLTNSKTYPTLLARIVREHSKNSRILLAPSDRKRFAKSAWAKKAEEAPIKGGVVLRTSRFDLNFSIDAAIEALGEQLSLEISNILFPDSASPKKPRRRK
jgi:vacuolar-type H+-ATPase subunit E/Vma4